MNPSNPIGMKVRKSKRDLADPYVDLPPKKIETQVRADKVTNSLDFANVAERVAKSSVFYLNWYYTDDSKFPNREWLRRVSRYFPYAEGGPLLVDEPRNDSERDWAELKKPLMKELGFRYAVIESGDSDFEILEQLGEI